MNTNSAELSVVETQAEKELYFSPTMGIRIMNGDLLMNNEFIMGSIESADPTTISYKDDHVLLIVMHSELAHFLHLVYQYSDKNIISVLDGLFEYEADHTDDAGVVSKQQFVAQLMTLTESYINK